MNPDPPYPPHPPVPPEPLAVPGWRRSSFCEPNSCVEVAWHTSTRCDTGSCVAVAHRDGRVLVRDSKLGNDSPVLTYTRSEWLEELDNIRRDGIPFDAMLRTDTEWQWFRDGVSLWFTEDEMDAFVAGVRGGEFDVPGVDRV